MEKDQGRPNYPGSVSPNPWELAMEDEPKAFKRLGTWVRIPLNEQADKIKG
jgi:hypothetical protein